MSKSRPKRRLNKRARRSIRRTSAVVLLITAIIVAAIPVPEVGAAEDDPVTPVSTLVYPSSFEDFDISFDTSLIGTLDPTGKTTRKAYTVRPMSDGAWQYNWQFEFYQDPGKAGVVSKYNSAYQQDEVTLNPNVVTQYVTVTETEYATFYSTTVAAKKYSVTYDEFIKKTASEEAVKFFEKYFPDAYKAYSDIWNKHKAAHDRWEALPSDQKLPQDEPKLAEGDVELSKTPADLSEGENGTANQKLEYYCDMNGYPGAVLVRVYDDTERTGAGTTEGRKVVYMPQGGTSSAGYLQDTNKFWYHDTNTTEVIAIAEKAFKGVENVKILHLPDEIKYIGQEAFMGSFIQRVTFQNVEAIGHRAFKECSQLVEVTLNDGTKVIGNEAFYATNITSIRFTYSIARIGSGAFANCTYLQNVDLSAITQTGSALSDFAFYNDVALNTVEFGNSRISSIGKGCFAVASGVTGTLNTFVFPSTVATEDQFGDYMFAGRTNMSSVTMPADYGRNSTVKIPAHTFEGCINLGCIEFPADGGGSCGYATFDKDLFANVINEAFYIKGPELDREGQVASPRKATWAAHTRVSEYVPYNYTRNGVEYWEVSKDNYLLLVDGKGNLESCTVVEGKTLPPGFELIIPEQVGTIKVNAINRGCFDKDPEIKKNVGKVTIKDGSISKIDSAVFANCPMLKEVYAGDTVNDIGSEAFVNCPQLTDITFNSPANGNYSSFKIGKDALTTGSTKLTVHADVVDGYAPFTWAMNVDNYVDRITGTRVCYRGLSPKYMTVIIDNETNLPTLVDYPKYDRVDMENQDYIDELAFYYVSKYGKQTQTSTGTETPGGEESGGGGTTEPGGEENGGTTEPGGEENGGTTEPGGEGGGGTTEPGGEETDSALTITVGKDMYASLNNGILLASLDEDDGDDTGDNGDDTDDTGSTSNYEVPDPRDYHIDDYKDFAKQYSIIKKYETYVVDKHPASYEWQTMTPKELDIINATRELVVPSGIRSIDARSFFEDASGANSNSILAYFRNTDINYQMCQPGQGSNKDNVQPGIFSGYYKDYDANKEAEAAKQYEQQIKGNDRVESIILTSVEYLPDYAFDSCERLHTVILGDACRDIGTAPFRGCTNLINVGGNQYYTSENGIIYSKRTDGTLQIEECLSARGSSGTNSIGTKYIDAVTDPLLANVSSIAEGAFQNCDYISKVDLSVMEKVKSIPKACFNDCDSLSDVMLPVTVNEIQEEAFSDTPTGLSVTIPGIEVSIEDSAFDHNEGTIRTYADSAAYTYARYHNIDIELLSEKHKVTFLDYDGTELDVQYVEDGGTAVAPDVPKRKGYEFTGWSDDYKGVTKDIWLIAQYKTSSSNGGNGSGSGSGSGSGGSGSSSGNDGSDSSESSGIHTVTVINGTGSGTYKQGETVTITANGPSLGQKFDKWLTNSLNVAMANVTSASTTFTMPDNSVVVTATFKSDGTRPTNGGTTTTTVSGNGTTTGNSSGTTVRINKSGISNTNLASAVVHGSSDRFMVVISDSAEAVAAVESALQGQYGERFPALRYTAMDISLYDATGTAKIENPQGISVDITIPIPDALIQYGGNNRAISVSNGVLEHLNTRFTVIDGVPCMSFTATHFSPYGVYSDTENLTASMDMTPKTGDGIHPKWFLSIGLLCASVVLFMKKDERKQKRRVRTA